MVCARPRSAASSFTGTEISSSTARTSNHISLFLVQSQSNSFVFGVNTHCVEEAVARNTGPVCRLCRREGEKLFLKGARCMSPKCSVERRNFPPGQHGKDTQ